MEEGPARLLASDLRRVVGEFVRAIRRDTGTAGSAQSEALELLFRLGPMNVTALAEKRGVTHQTMRLVVGQLDSAGLVHQHPDPSDGRSRLVTIASAGHEALARAQEARTSRIEDAIRSRLTPEEQDALRAALPLLARLAGPLE